MPRLKHTQIGYTFRPSEMGYEAELEWNPDGGGGFSTKATGETKGEAIARAAVLAEKVLDNPVVSALMPPQAKLAFEVAKKLGAAKALGKAVDVVGPGAKRLAKVLKFW